MCLFLCLSTVTTQTNVEPETDSDVVPEANKRQVTFEGKEGKPLKSILKSATDFETAEKFHETPEVNSVDFTMNAFRSRKS